MAREKLSPKFPGLISASPGARSLQKELAAQKGF